MQKGKAEANDSDITTIDIINPTQEAFQDFGEDNDEGNKEIPNVHLKFRDATNIGAGSGVNIQDANLLRIKTTYGYELKVPMINTLITEALKQTDPDNATYYDANRIPITAVATVRMQSEARQDGNLKADGSPSDDTTTDNNPSGSDDPSIDDPLGPDPTGPDGPACGAGTGTCCAPEGTSLAGTGAASRSAENTSSKEG